MRKLGVSTSLPVMTSRRTGQTWTFDGETVVEDLLGRSAGHAGAATGARRGDLGGGTVLGVWGPPTVALLVDSADHEPAGDRLLPLLTRDGGLPLTTVAGVPPGEPIWVWLRYVPETRPLGPGDLRYGLVQRGSDDPPIVVVDDPADRPGVPGRDLVTGL